MPRPVLLLSLAAFMAAAVTRACDALLPDIADTFTTSVAAASVAVTAFTFGYGACQLVYGPLGTRLGPYRLAAIGTALAASGALLSAAAGDLFWLAVGRLWSGMTAAAVIPMALVYIGNTVAYEQRQTVLARFLLGQVFGLAFGQAFAGLFAELLSWRQLFMLLGGGFVVVSAALFYEYYRAGIGRAEQALRARTAGAAGGAPPPGPLAQYAAVLRLPWARIVLSTVTLEGFLAFGAYPYIGVRLRQTFALDYATIGLLLALIGAGGLIYILLVRLLLRLLGETGLARVGGALMMAGYLLAAGSPLWPLFAAATLLIGLGFYMLHNTLQTNATQMAPEQRGAAIALFAFALFVSQALGAALFGVVGEAVGFAPLLAAAGIGLAALALAFAQARARRR